MRWTTLNPVRFLELVRAHQVSVQLAKLPSGTCWQFVAIEFEDGTPELVFCDPDKSADFLPAWWDEVMRR